MKTEKMEAEVSREAKLNEDKVNVGHENMEGIEAFLYIFIH